MTTVEMELAWRIGVRLRAADGSLEASVRRRLAEPGRDRRSVDLVINANELTTAHGTGVLLGRVLSEAPDHVLFRAFDSWSGARTTRPVAEYAFNRYSRPRTEIAEFIGMRLSPWKVGGILAVPYTREDVVMALTAKAMTGAPLAIWVMDDNTLISDGVPRALMEELVSVADAHFAISPGLQGLYSATYETPFHILPPLVASHLLGLGASRIEAPQREDQCVRLAMVGNVWSQSWLDRTLDVLTELDFKTDWYTSIDNIHFLELDPGRLVRAGISIRPGLDAHETARRAAEADLVLAPSTDLAEMSPQAQAIGRLSLPSKLAFVTGAVCAPILILANGPSGAAEYVRRFEVGLVSPYDAGSVRKAVEHLAHPQRQRDIRRRSMELATAFNVEGAYDLLMRSAEQRKLTDDRFERLFGAGPASSDRKLDIGLRAEAPAG